MDYAKAAGFNRKSAVRQPVAQSRPIPGRESEMSKNAAGGYGFNLDEFARTYRFLILGTEGGSFHVNEKTMTKDNLKAVQSALDSDPMRVIDMAAEVLREGRAFKTDPALFVLALGAAWGLDNVSGSTKVGTLIESENVRKHAMATAMDVIGQSTQLFHFMKFVQEMRGWGPSLRKAFARWYVTMPEDKLALQVTKYKNRDGVTHQDMLRLAHPKWPSVEKASRSEKTRSMILRYAARPKDSLFADADLRSRMLDKKPSANVTEPMLQIAATEELLRLEGTGKAEVSRAVKLIIDHGLTHEMVPGHLKNSAEVWAALAEHMPVIATLRNLGKMTQVGAISTLSRTESVIVNRLTDKAQVERSRAHPIQFLIALKQYEAGKGLKGSLTWSPTQNIQSALDEAFPLAFGNVPRTGKRVAVAVDVSGSMTMPAYGGMVLGLDGWLPAEVAGAMAYVHMHTEPNSALIAFWDKAEFEKGFSRRMTVSQCISHFRQSRGGTDTGAPMKLLLDTKTDVDAVITYTDNQTWAGQAHVVALHKRYVQQVNHPVRFINCATSAISTTDVDPNNADMFEMCGFDASAPRVISDFIGGRF